MDKLELISDFHLIISLIFHVILSCISTPIEVEQVQRIAQQKKAWISKSARRLLSEDIVPNQLSIPTNLPNNFTLKHLIYYTDHCEFMNENALFYKIPVCLETNNKFIIRQPCLISDFPSRMVVWLAFNEHWSV